MKKLTDSELKQINGGDSGEHSDAYNAGKKVGEYLHDAVEIAEGYLAYVEFFA